MDALTAIKEVLKTAVANGALVSGPVACEEALAGGRVRFCVVAVDRAEPESVVSRCAELRVHLIKVPESQELRRWAGIGEAAGDDDDRVSTCVAVSRHANERTEALTTLMELIGEPLPSLDAAGAERRTW
jgi:ribosomal protein L7Ae-like RNA K-turn-binding protein